MNNKQFERIIQSIDSLTEAVRNLQGGTGDKRRVANAKIEREVFERKQMEHQLSYPDLFAVFDGEDSSLTDDIDF